MYRVGLPIVRAGQAVGLLGGSFDPAHRGHVHITDAAMRRFGLDRVWWLMSPGNPLKAKGPAPLGKRMATARVLIRNPRVTVTDLEARLGTRYTAETLARLLPMYPGVRFVWLMGADNMATFHRWGDWRSIAAAVPIGVIARPGQRMAARTSPAARILRGARLGEVRSMMLAHCEPPAWCMINVPLSTESSTGLRALGAWPR